MYLPYHFYFPIHYYYIPFFLSVAGEYEAYFDGCGEEIYEEEEEECCGEMEPSLSQAEVAECSNSNKRLSKDSGMGSDIEQDSLRGMYSRKSSHGRNSDSGVCVRAGGYVCMYDQTG